MDLAAIGRGKVGAGAGCSSPVGVHNFPYADAMNLVFAPFVYRDNARGTESLLTLRWRELDSNFPYAGAINLVFAPFVSRSIVRVLPEAHPARPGID
jgi:hypothetical protein